MRDQDREKFKELAEKRVNRAIKDLSLIGNLANKSNYMYDEADVKKIMRALKEALDDVKAKFDAGDSGAKKMFTLD